MNKTTMNDTLDLTAAKAAVMKAARHLNASRMAWVANRWTSGINWRGCTKGHIAESLVKRTHAHGRNPSPITQRDLDALCLRLRMQPGADGKMALLASDADAIGARVLRLRARAKKLEAALALHKSGEKVHFGVEYEHADCVRTADRLERAILEVLQ